MKKEESNKRKTKHNYKNKFDCWCVVFVNGKNKHFIHAYEDADFADIGLISRKIAFHREKCEYKIMKGKIEIDE
mgnify:CR=1 FL=1